MTTYTVKKGDSLSKIAEKFGTTVTAIQKANSNKIKNVNDIRVGWVLKIPVSEDCEKIRTQFRTALKDVQNLSSVKKLKEMLGG